MRQGAATEYGRWLGMGGWWLGGWVGEWVVGWLGYFLFKRIQRVRVYKHGLGLKRGLMRMATTVHKPSRRQLLLAK